MPNLLSAIRHLYINQKLSTKEIALKLGISQWTVLSRMRRNDIPRRCRSEVDALLFSKKPLTYHTKTGLNRRERNLRQAALMLYWAEGSKKGKHTIDFANSEPNMVLIFLNLLRNIYQVNEKKLRVFLYCYENQDSKKLVDYWSKVLKVPRSRFTKPYVRRGFDIAKSGRMPFGLAHIRYGDKRLLMQIKAEIDKIQHSLTSQGD